MSHLAANDERELERLVNRLCDQTASSDDVAALSQWLADDPEACDYYITCMALHGELAWQFGPAHCFSAADLPMQALAETQALAEASAAELSLRMPTAPVHSPRDGSWLGQTWRGSLQTVGGVWHSATEYFEDHPMKLAYLITTTLFIVAAPILWHWKVASSNSTIAAASHATKLAGSQNSTATLVGRVTATVGCTWSVDGQQATSDKSTDLRNLRRSASQLSHFVYRGDTFLVTAGLMEITYDTGATVVLQSPCTYTSDVNGGFLAVGRLTGKMEKKASGAKPQAVSNGSPRPSPLAPSPSFTIATPTTIITDLGTEFGVDVASDKRTMVHVIRGAVEAVRDNQTGGAPFRERLTAGQAIYIASLNDMPQRITASANGGSLQNGDKRPTHVIFAPELRVAFREAHEARKSQEICKPTGIVASAYHNICDTKGKLFTKQNREAAFRVATDGVFGRGEAEEGPRSSFDTESAASGRRLEDAAKQHAADKAKPQAIKNHISNQKSLPTPHNSPSTNLTAPAHPHPTAFVGLRYAEPTRFDRLKIFLAEQTQDGGSWTEMPRVFILKNPVDTDQASPENDTANWRELPMRPFFGPAFTSKPTKHPGEVIEIPLVGFSVEDRTGYGWAVGGVPGNGTRGYISITELRAYTSPEGDDLPQKQNNKSKTAKQTRLPADRHEANE